MTRASSMIGKPQPPDGNSVLSLLSSSDREALLARAQLIRLEFGTVLADAEQLVGDVYFPLTAVLSVLSIMADGSGIETVVVGHEGMAPLAAFHGASVAAEQVIVQIPGKALRLARSDFDRLVTRPGIARALHRYAQAAFTFAAQASGCNRRHSVVQRCARWLLLTHDRTPGDTFPLTHLVLAQMLGVRRSSVTVAAEALRAGGAIGYTRGNIRVINRAALEQRSCECYSIIRSTYDRLLLRGDTASPIAALRLAEGGRTIAHAGEPGARISPPVGIPMLIEDSRRALDEFSEQVRESHRRSEALRVEADASPDAAAAVDALSVALEQLQVAEEELRVQVETLVELREALERQHHLWRARLDGLPDAFIETDGHDRIIEVNRAAEQLLRRQREGLIGKPFPVLVAVGDRSGLRRLLTDLREGAQAARWTGTLLVADQADLSLDVAATGFHAEGSRPDRFLGARWLLRPQLPDSLRRAPPLT